MNDNLHKKRPQDSSRVNIHEPWEVEYWCKEFNCTKLQLALAVEKHGTSAAAIRKYFNK